MPLTRALDAETRSPSYNGYALVTGRTARGEDSPPLRIPARVAIETLSQSLHISPNPRPVFFSGSLRRGTFSLDTSACVSLCSLTPRLTPPPPTPSAGVLRNAASAPHWRTSLPIGPRRREDRCLRAS
ncbi:hypothetical protein SKAU_G00185010 [Synaphobranchus kaupii]|uniref:Uncharacterized protein n=1 Tax=Synaphobranchus kaupii TaxID=118154 RepID=A0A9Q1FCH0_SYNKA|nr:hypothetical protein SKAU_G00185010 [Synaphobranchus kaupii]